MSCRAESPLVRARGLVKSYDGSLAVRDVDFEVRPGEVVGLVGKNGAGKSTVIKILAGGASPDAGTVEIGGEPIPDHHSPSTAHAMGLAVMFQELEAVAELSVAENVLMGSSYPRRLGGLVDWRAANRAVAAVLAQLEVITSPRQRMGALSNAQQRMVMIARALYHDAKLLVLDEPTASLSDDEVAHLYRVVRGLRDSGRSVVYVSHRLGEVFDLTDRVVVMRDGAIVHEAPTAALNRDLLVDLITGDSRAAEPGRDDARPAKAAIADAPVVLSVDELVGQHAPHRISFDLHVGEILGIGGLVGSGRSELVRTIVGADRVQGGTVTVRGRRRRFRSPRSAMRAGVALLPEDRRGQGLWAGAGVRENVTMASMQRHTHFGLISKASERRAVGKRIDQLSIKARSQDQHVNRLSGGNQQKVIIARLLERDLDAVILDEPSQGIDIQAKEEIFELIRATAEAGRAVILISSDLSELVALCHRVLILREGRLAGELAGQELSEASILKLSYAATESKSQMQTQ